MVGVSLGADLGSGVLPTLYNAPGSSNPTSLLFSDKFKTDVYAVFGSAEYELSDAFTAGVALRYDVEDRTASSRVPNVNDPITSAKINPGLPATGSIPDKDATFKQLQPKVTISWQPTSTHQHLCQLGHRLQIGWVQQFGFGLGRQHRVQRRRYPRQDQCRSDDQ